MDRARTEMAGNLARRLESAFGKSSMLVQAESQYGDPKAWRRSFDVSMAATPADVQGAAKRWLSDGAYVLTILPRPAFAVASAGLRPLTVPAASETKAAGFPRFERTTLANGLKVIVASRRETPIVNFSLMFEPGFSAEDAKAPAGTRAMTLDLMDEGTTSRTGLEISDALRGLGANLSVDGGDERASVSLSTLTSTLDPALAIFADVTLNPAFRPEDLERVRKQAIVGVESERRQPRSAGPRALRPILFGAAHPYGRVTTEASLTAFTGTDARAYHRRWFTPDNATLIVVGDTTLAEVRPKIEKAFAGWQKGNAARLPVPDAPAVKPGFYVIDRPGAQQSFILGAAAAPRWNAEDEIALTLMNDAFGGTFTSRLNMNLREGKGWSYGVRSFVDVTGRGPRAYQMSAPVQTDKTAESVLELRREFTELATVRPVTVEELAQVKNDTTLALPGRWETLSAVTGAIGDLAYRGLPDDYWSSFADRVKATSAEELTKVSAKVVRPQDVVWVIVGDRAKIVPELEKRGIGPIVIVDGDGRPVK
jgi:zinc protease